MFDIGQIIKVETEYKEQVEVHLVTQQKVYREVQRYEQQQK